MPARKKGFTLIELLVVIAIIAILAAILFPVFARAREAARKSQCSSNMKECGIALQTYWNDYDATLPSSMVTWYAQSPTATNPPTTWNATDFQTFACVLGVCPVPTGQSPKTWAQMLYSHMKNKDIMFCPSDSTDHNPTTANAYKLDVAPVSYFWKFAIDRAWWGPLDSSNGKTQKESDFGYNSDQLVFFERAGFHSNASQGLKNDIKINCVYLDTHVKFASIVNGPSDYVMKPVEAGEPWYYNFAQDQEKINGKNPPDSSVATTYLDPRYYSDLLP